MSVGIGVRVVDRAPIICETAEGRIVSRDFYRLSLERLGRDIAKARRRLTGARIYGGTADPSTAPEAG